MKALEEKIRKEGKLMPGDVLKVDNFLNHQIDVRFLDEMGLEFKRLFGDVKVTKILTIEASGISIGVVTSKYFDYCPVVFAKKTAAKNMSADIYSAGLHSYTRGIDHVASVSKNYISSDDKVLIVDDFLANGEALKALISICEQAGAEVVGCGIIVEKAYQPGGKMIRERGITVHSLAKVSYLDDTRIEFED